MSRFSNTSDIFISSSLITHVVHDVLDATITQDPTRRPKRESSAPDYSVHPAGEPILKFPVIQKLNGYIGYPTLSVLAPHGSVIENSTDSHIFKAPDTGMPALIHLDC